MIVGVPRMKGLDDPMICLAVEGVASFVALLCW